MSCSRCRNRSSRDFIATSSSIRISSVLDNSPTTASIYPFLEIIGIFPYSRILRGIFQMKQNVAADFYWDTLQDVCVSMRLGGDPASRHRRGAAMAGRAAPDHETPDHAAPRS